MPNFIPVEQPARPRQEGFEPSVSSIPVTQLSEDEAVEYGEYMKQTFIEHWRERMKSLHI